MIDLIMGLIPGGSLTAIGAAIVAVLAGVFGIYRSGKKSGRNEEKAKEAEARAKNLDRIRRAADARPTGDIVSDPNNRDRRK